MATYSQPMFKQQYGRSRNVWIVVQYCIILGARHQYGVHVFSTERAARNWIAQR